MAYSVDLSFLADFVSWGLILARHLDLPLRSHNYTAVNFLMQGGAYLDLVGILLDECEIALIRRNLC
jgi:hypothetical protein